MIRSDSYGDAADDGYSEENAMQLFVNIPPRDNP